MARLVTVLFLLCFAAALCATIEYEWGITSVSADSITAWVTAHNVNGNETLGILFDNWPWVELFVDGAWDLNAPDSTGIIGSETLIIWDDYTCEITYNPADPIPFGDHQVDVRRYQAPWIYNHFLDSQQVYLPATFEYISFSSLLINATPQQLNASITLYNHSASDCVINFPDNHWIRLFLDGEQITPSYQSNPSWLVIPPGNAYTASFLYLPAAPLTWGEHELRFQVEDYGFLPALGFTLVDPSSVEDEIAPPMANIGVYPNPFQLETRFFCAREAQLTELKVYDLRGRLVRTLQLSADGENQASCLWNGEDDRGRKLPGGMYLVAGTNKGKVYRAKVLLTN